ncbi:MAG: GMP/IMP nucleotidase [Gammaproteobacteria bacterium]|nr:MAG: GMP/IMP nucleotidase [Gammaproteobacteria bacterium]
MAGSSEYHKSIEALSDCDTLMLDMDGTLLDLAYDNYMWREHIPAEYARRNSMGEAEAREMLSAKFRSLEGKLQWYCLDHWSEVLDLDVKALHRRENARICFLPGARDFLQVAQKHDVRVLLVTNSHRDTLEIKTEVTGIADFFDAVYTSHEMGHAKEDQPFWHALYEAEGFDRETTLFIDDNPIVLESARTFGISMLLNVTRPDTRWPAREHRDFPAIESVASLLSQEPNPPALTNLELLIGAD